MPRLSLFCGAEYFALASGRSGQTFDGKPYRLQKTAHSAFGAICGQDAAVGHRVIDAVKMLSDHISGCFSGAKASK